MKPNRLIAVFSAICILFTGLYLRIGSIMSNEAYQEAGKQQSSYTLTLPESRGMIFDCNFSPMVNQTTEYIAAVLPQEGNYSTILRYNTDYTEQELQQLYAQGKPFLCHVSTYEFQEVGVTLFPISQRYGEESLASHIIGYLDHDGNGVSGIERAYDEFLTKNIVPTTLTYTLDGTGTGRSDQKPNIQYGNSPDNGVVLTLDRDIQQICEKAAANHLTKGAVVVMECDTGKIRGMCSFPNFTQNNLEESLSDQENSPLLNRALTPMSVGSTFKIVVTAAGLENGYDPSLTYNCTGVYQLEEQNFHCHLRTGHGIVDLKQALMVSCNPFFIQLGLSLEPDSILKAANDLSFGKQTELAPGLYAQAGSLPVLEDLQNPGQIANLSFGQGKLTATPIQLAQMISAVANGGFTPTPILVEGLTRDGKTITEQAEVTGIQSLSASTAALLKEDLIACVMEREGQNALPSLTTAGGKTATAQTGIYEDGEELDNGGFVGFFPAEDPKYAVAIMAEEAVSGNENASPVFREIADAITLLNK